MNIRKYILENHIPFKTFWAWFTPDNKFIEAPKLNHDLILRRYYPELAYNNELPFDQAMDDGWVRVIFEYDRSKYMGILSINAKTKKRIVDILKYELYDLISTGNNYIYIDYSHGSLDKSLIFSTYDSNTKQKLINWLS